MLYTYIVAFNSVYASMINYYCRPHSAIIAAVSYYDGPVNAAVYNQEFM